MQLLKELIEAGGTRLWIGGEWREASDGVAFDVLDPATGESITSVSSGSADDADAAVSAAAAAAEEWATTPPRDRAEILRRAFELMAGEADGFAELIVAEMGKALTEARGEATYAAEFFRWYSGEAVRNEGALMTAPAGDKRIISIHQPVGVSLLVTPWNFPAAMATRKLGPAIAAGCTTILKPASDTPLTALAMARLLDEAGLPPGVVNVVPSNRSSEVVPAMLADDRVRKLSFTGSTEVGRGLLEHAAKRVVNCSMELGGNAPFIVFGDADLDEAVAGLMVAKMRNGGQSCIAANRIYVEASVADDFASRFTAAMAAVKVGPGLEPGVDLGPVINKRARDDMKEMVEKSSDAGSEVALGGAPIDRPGWFYPPTVLTDVDPSDPILSEEIFGPVAPLVRFGDEAEVITMANETEHGLASYVYTSDLSRGLRVAEALEAGMVGVNRGLISDPAAPFGGVKQSGIGREGGHQGLAEFLETKYVAASW